MKEVLPGVLHWTRVHPKIKVEVSSYYLVEERVLLDPLAPAEGVESLPNEPRTVLLTNRHHWRDSRSFVDRFGCEVYCVESGLHEFKAGEPVTPFRWGEELPGGIEAIEIGALCPDETALAIPRGEGIVALADGAIRYPDADSPLGFVPEQYMGDDPETVKAGLRKAYSKLLDREFDHLLLAHGHPWIGGGKAALRAFVKAGG